MFRAAVGKFVCNLFQLLVAAKTNFDNALSFDGHVLRDLFGSHSVANRYRTSYIV